jgi:head-tail adaptor
MRVQCELLEPLVTDNGYERAASGFRVVARFDADYRRINGRVFDANGAVANANLVELRCRDIPRANWINASARIRFRLQRDVPRDYRLVTTDRSIDASTVRIECEELKRGSV